MIDGNGDSVANGKQHEPRDVFTPRVPAGALMFVSRSGFGIGRKLADALNSLGAQVIVYGDTGVGKTTLVSAVAGSAIARVECFSSKSFADLVRDAFGAMGAVRELELIERDEVTSSSEVGGGIGFLVSMKADLYKGQTSSEERRVEVYETPLIDALLDALKAVGKTILFFDNFENVQSASVRTSVSELMTAFADRAVETNNTKLVVAGIADTAAELVTVSQASGRRVVSVGIPQMPDYEIAEIIVRGMGLLRIRVTADQVSRITRLSCGYPYVAHLLGLHAAESADRLVDQEITDGMLDDAVRSAIGEIEFEFGARYELAREKTGNVRPRQRLLHTMAEAGEREYQFAALVDAYGKKFGTRTSYNFLNQALAG